MENQFFNGSIIQMIDQYSPNEIVLLMAITGLAGENGATKFKTTNAELLNVSGMVINTLQKHKASLKKKDAIRCSTSAGEGNANDGLYIHLIDLRFVPMLK